MRQQSEKLDSQNKSNEYTLKNQKDEQYIQEEIINENIQSENQSQTELKL